MTFDKEPIFIIGYPKSGNTWLSRICASALDSPIVTGDDSINQAGRKDVYTGQFDIYKIHFSSRDRPNYVTDDSKKIYIVRDFRDVLISGYFFNHKIREEHLMLKNQNNLLNRIYRAYFYHQIRRMINCWTADELIVLIDFFKKKKVFVGNWSDHVRYWMSCSNVVMVKYEDLLQNPYNIMQLSFSRLGVSCSNDRLRGVIDEQSFSKKKDSFISQGDDINIRFLRKGNIGDWKHFLNDDILKIIRKQHGQVMNLLGYEI